MTVSSLLVLPWLPEINHAVPHLQGCIPVFLRDEHILPFSEELDWNRASLFLWQQELPGVEELLADVGERIKESMRQQVLCSRGVAI